jgi:UDP-N-acetylmuramoylalanine--D-glutamate ligase
VSNFFDKKKVLVCGMARSGQSAARLLRKLGADVTAQDLKEDVDWTFPPEAENIHLYLGKNPDAVVEMFDMLVVSPGIPFNMPFIEKARSLNIPVWGELELAYSCCKCPIVAITGTNGKTTVTTLVGEILRKKNPQTLVAGNIGIPFTDRVTELTPESLAVLEVSSFQLETAHNFKPAVAAVLNLTPDHLNRHKTMEHYRALKERVFINQQPGDAAVLNYDDPCCRLMKPPGRAIFFSEKERLEEGVFLDGNFIRARLDGIDERIIEISETRVLTENALAAAAIALLSGASVTDVSETLKNFKGVEHRIEYVGEYNGVAYYNDSKATNADAAIKGLSAMRRPVVLIGGGYDKQVTFDGWVGMFKGRVKFLVVMGQTAGQIIETCRAFSFEDFDRVNSLRDAVTLAAAHAKPGDCVLLSPACASWDMFDNFEQRGQLFKQFAREINAQ